MLLLHRCKKILSKAVDYFKRAQSQAEYVPMYIFGQFPALSLGRRVVLVHGNCQATPTAKLLNRSPEFRARFRIVIVPPVHLIKAWQVASLHRIVSIASVLITQEIRNGYRGYAIGSNELAELLPSGSDVIKIPVLYFEGNYPFQVYIRSDGGAFSAPVTEYADLRAVAAAALGLNDLEASEWFTTYEPPEEAIRIVAENSIANLKAREESLTIRNASGYILNNSAKNYFHTVNHPKNDLLIFQSKEILNYLGLRQSLRVDAMKEFLGDLKTPINWIVAKALGQEESASNEWIFRGVHYDELDLLANQFRWLRSNETALNAARHQHASRLALFFPDHAEHFRV